MKKRIAILGSTGSIGRSALKVIEWLNSMDDGKNRFEVVALTACSQVGLLAGQVRSFRPRYAAVADTSCCENLRRQVSGIDVEVMAGPASLCRIAELDEVDIVLTAVVGMAGLESVLAAASAGKTLAVANKEPLVVAGELLMATARANGGKILPVDSEHSAVFQAMQAGAPGEVSRIILTASGGPFRNCSLENIRNVTIEQALNHPVWDMGPKITIDSATMMNKALEVIEAHRLFNIDVDKVEVLVHPQSIVHSLVEFVDGSVVAQLGEPDMCLPIQYALTYPDRVAGMTEPLDLESIGNLTFEKPDFERFRALSLGYQVARAGGTAPAVFNAANETAVQEFLAGRISFVNIMHLVERCLNCHQTASAGTLEDLLEADAWARRHVLESAAADCR